MSTAVAEHPGIRPFRPPPWLIVGGITIVCAAVAVSLLRDAQLPLPMFQGACQRLRSSGLPITPADWFCHPVPWSQRAAFVAASFLVGLGYTLPAAILAATGRRLTALAPLLVAPAAFGHFSSIDWLGPGAVVMTRKVALLMVMLGVPVVAISVAARHRRRVGLRPRLLGALGSAVVCAGASFGVIWLARSMMSDHFASLGGPPFAYAFIMPAALSTTAFGLLLGSDRRWWPWSLVPVAVLLSMGPSIALVVGPERVLDWSQFGAVAPLVAIGLVWSAWRPVALRLTSAIYHEPAVANDVPREASLPRRVRPTVVANAAAAGLVIVSILAFRADPLPFQIGTVLPTFLGERIAVNDIRASMNLRLGISAMDAYRERTGTYRGFDAQVGAAAEPTLAWFDGIPAGDAATDDRILRVSIVAVSDQRARVATLSASGDAFCLERTSSGLAFGKSVDDTQQYGPPTIGTLRDAVRNCGSTPWTAAAVRPFPIATMCDGMAPYSGYLICRMVQSLSVDIMREPDPA